MARVSVKQPLGDNEERLLLEKLFLTLSSFGNWQEAESFFSEFLTRQETEMLAKRLELYKRVVGGEKYKRIMRDLKVTPQTVSTFRKKASRADAYFLRILRKLVAIDKKA